jgi:hypothetical protein
MKRRLALACFVGILASFHARPAAAAGVSASTASASAGDAHGFGEKGQLILSADRLFPFFSYSSQSVTRTNNGTTETVTEKGSSLVLLLGSEGPLQKVHTIPRVAADFTVIDRLTIGGAIIIAFGLGGSTTTETVQNNQTTTQTADSPTRTTFGIAPRVGYILPLGDFLAFWPRAGFAFYSVRDKATQVVNPTTTTVVTLSDTVFSLDLDPNLVIVPTEHFFFAAGPLINIPLAGTRKFETTTGPQTNSESRDLTIFHLGISLSLGGWLSL